MATKLERITQLSRENPDMVFTSIGHLINVEMLKSCHEKMGADKAVGIDGVRVGLIGPFQVGLKGPQMSRVKKANVWDYQSGRLGSAQTRPSSGRRQERDTVPFCRTGYSVSFRQGLPGRWRVQRTVP